MILILKSILIFFAGIMFAISLFFTIILMCVMYDIYKCFTTRSLE